MGQSGRSTRSEASGPGDPVIIDCSAEPVRIASSRVFHNSSEGSGQAHSNAGRAGRNAVRFLINAHVGDLATRRETVACANASHARTSIESRFLSSLRNRGGNDEGRAGGPGTGSCAGGPAGGGSDAFASGPWRRRAGPGVAQLGLVGPR